MSRLARRAVPEPHLSSQPCDWIFMTSMVNRKDVGAAAGRPLYLQLVDWLRAGNGRPPSPARASTASRNSPSASGSAGSPSRGHRNPGRRRPVHRRQGLGSSSRRRRLVRAPPICELHRGHRSQGRTLRTGCCVSVVDRPAAEGLPYPETTRLIGLDRLRLVDGAPTAIHRSVLDAALRTVSGSREDCR